MRDFVNTWKAFLLYMFTPPWQSFKEIDNDGSDIYNQPNHILWWIVGWAVTLLGIVAGGIFAPYLVTQLHIPTIEQDEVVIVIAFAAGFFQQAISILLITFAYSVYQSSKSLSDFRNGAAGTFLVLVSITLVIGLPSFAIYYYSTHFAPSHDLTGTGIVGGTALKIAVTFGFPLLKGIVSGAIFRWFFKWIRGDTTKSAT